MNSSKLLGFIFCLGLVSACASQGWQPTVDPYGDANADLIDEHLEECRQLALKASGGTASSATKGTAIGAGVGAAVGAVIGAVSGNAGSGAATGAAIGGSAGGVKSGVESEGTYKSSYRKCMRNRGHKLLD
ncbi:MAG: hypothetical protein G3M78_11535 [Candidatus Nitrohelix vancouverensis]|uniref:Glycine-zipper-containing OmpA-like membrane domain-containing protein n=1 Tax=Candidatus Nitrohelix vancouverensis TaxID=2705534 RepID=A0A7T0G413_9BACT|nr:MAG: hypothetical protein G3M78_11535 [Candidatus Nitrohelix vancouverensis]